MAGFVHRRRPVYADVDQQGVVFHGHWLAYFDDAMTRFVDWLGFPPKATFAGHFDVMVVKASLEWSGPAGFDDEVDIEVEPVRLGTASFDLRYTASVAGATVCTAVVTYVSVTPGTPQATPIPEDVRAKLEAQLAGA
ncbi:MAG: acyl-CoA thioesterase [Acidimicrobiia bacterium]